ncbi:MAG: hypothetical protein ABIT76_08445 [Chthoniobacterales bacterium]
MTKSLPACFWPLLLTCGVFGSVFFSGTQHNDFPYFYHTDEPSKAVQLVSGERNFYHPALMLNSTDAVARVLGVSREKQEMVVVGRTMSAFFAALAVTGFALAAWRVGGVGAGLLAGAFCALSADFFDAAHYMKEDPYWISGLSFTFLAALHYWRKPGAVPAILLGLAAGWSVAGKYIGFIALLVAVLTIVGKMIASRSRHFLPIFLCLLSAAVIFLTINYQILSEPRIMTAGLSKEVGALYNEHHQKNEKFKPSRYLDLLHDTVPGVAIALAAGLLVYGFAKWKRTPLPELLFLLLPVILGIALTLTPKGSARYFLPIGLMLLTSAATALVMGVKTLQLRSFPIRLTSWILGAAAVCAILIPLGKEYKIRHHAFATDYRKNLADYIRQNVPANALIASDQRAAIPSADDPRFAGFPNLLPNKMLITRYVADLGTLDELLAKGVTYVVVASRDANRLGNDENFSREDQKKLPARRQFYQDLTKRGTVEWKSKLGDNKYLNVSLILYRIAP